MYYSAFTGNIRVTIDIKLDASGAMKATRDMQRYFFEGGLTTDLINLAAKVVANIKGRLKKSVAMTDWRHPGPIVGMRNEWVQRYFERRAATHLARVMESTGFTEKILDKINASQPIGDIVRGFFIGIGNMQELDSILTNPYKDKRINIWRVLEFGTGIYNVLEARPYIVPTDGVVRNSMVFWFARRNKWVLFKRPIEHPGQKGRHYFLTENMQMHSEDRATFEALGAIINSKVKRFSRR